MSENEEVSAEDRMMKVKALKAGKTEIKRGNNKTAKRVSGSGCWRQRQC